MCLYLNRIYKYLPCLTIILSILSVCSVTSAKSLVKNEPVKAQNQAVEVEFMASLQPDAPEINGTQYADAHNIDVGTLPVAPQDNPASLKPSAPDQYTVQKGDTLWDLSSTFLKEPWYWPEIWYMNPQVENPHLIYPGDVINVFYVGGRPYLTVDGDVRASGIERLSPMMRGEPIDALQKVIPIQAIEKFLIRPQIVTSDQLEASPYIIGSRDNRLVYGANDIVYLHNSTHLVEGNAFNVYRAGTEFKDPNSGEILGYEAIHVGDGELIRAGDPATLHLTETSREVLPGDRIIKIENIDADSDFYPRPAGYDIKGQVIYLFDAISQVGTYQIVAVNIGGQQGLEKGHVLAINKAGNKVRDPYQKVKTKQMDLIQLPPEKSADAIAFRVFDRISYLLILDADRPIRNGDAVTAPEL